MIAVPAHQHPADLEIEFRAAIARLDADMQIITYSSEHAGRDVLESLAFWRSRVVAAYHDALFRAAGAPHDPAWRLLELATVAFTARIPHGLGFDAIGAAMRLRALAGDESAT